MDSTTPQQRRSRVPYGLLGMIALVVVIETIVAGCHGIRGHGIGYEWWLTFERAALGAQRYEILCFGDSQMKLDVQPRVLQPILGRTVFDLAVIGGQAPSSYFLLRRALDAGARPKVVLVDYYQTLLTAFLGRNREWWPLVLTPQDALEMSWNSGEAGTLTDWILYHSLPTFRYRNAIRNALGIGDIVLNPYEEANLVARNTAQNLGALAADEDPTYKDDPTKLHPAIAPLPFNCTELNALYIRKFLDLAAQHDIRVFYLICPCSPNWQRGSREKDPDGRYERAIQNHILRYKNVQIIDGRPGGYESALFRDHSHLSHRGATAFSTDLAYLLRKELGSDATRAPWIKLRRLDVAPPPFVLELSAESGRIAQERNARRRR